MQSSQADPQEECWIWKEYPEKIKLMVVWMKREKDKEKETTAWTKSLEALTEKVNTSRDPGQAKLVEMLEKKWKESKNKLKNSMHSYAWVTFPPPPHFRAHAVLQHSYLAYIVTSYFCWEFWSRCS